MAFFPGVDRGGEQAMTTELLVRRVRESSGAGGRSVRFRATEATTGEALVQAKIYDRWLFAFSS